MEEPYLLASYGVDSVTDADPFAVRVNGLQYQEDSVVNGSTSSRAKQRERQPVAVTTVQRNGVHLVDATDQSPLSTLTVSPATVFTAAAVAVSLPKASAVKDSIASTSKSAHIDRERKIFAGVRNPDQADQHELWCWTETERADGSSEGAPSRTSKQLPLQFSSAILALSVQIFPLFLLVATQDGSFHVLSLQLEIIASAAAAQLCPDDSAKSQLLYAASFQVDIPSAYLPSELKASPSPSVIALAHIRRTRTSTVSKKAKALANGRASDTEASHLLDVSCAVALLSVDMALRRVHVRGWSKLPNGVHSPTLLPDAVISAISSSGTLQTYNLEARPVQTVDDARQTVGLTARSWPSQGEKQSVERFVATQPCTASNGSVSRILRASTTGQKRQIGLSIFDPRFQAVTASHEFAVSGLASTGDEDYDPRHLSVELGQLPGNLFVVAHTYKFASTARRGYIHAVSITSPQVTKLASVLGNGIVSPSVDDAASGVVKELARHITGTKGMASPDYIADLLRGLQAMPSRSLHYARLAQLAAPRVEGASGTPYRPARELVAQFLLEQSDFSDDLYRPCGFTAALLDANMMELAMRANLTLPNVTERSLVRCLICKARQTPNTRDFSQALTRLQTSHFCAQSMQTALREECSAEDLAALLPAVIADFSTQLPIGKSAGVKKVSTKSHTDMSQVQYDAKISFVSCLVNAHLVTMLREQNLHQHLRTLQQAVRQHVLVHGAILAVQHSIKPLTPTSKSEKTIVQPSRPQRTTTEVEERETRTRSVADRAREKAARKTDHLKQIQADKYARKQRLLEDSLTVGDYRAESIVL